MQLETSRSGANRMAVVRRVYIYTVALISYIVGLIAFDNLTHTLLEIWLPEMAGRASAVVTTAGELNYWRQALARSGGTLLVAAALFLLHWWYGNHRLTEPEERASALRKLYLYAAILVAGIFVYGSIYQLIKDLLAYLLLDFRPATSAVGDPAGWLQSGLMTVVGAALLWYWQQILLGDGDYGREESPAAFVRRLFLLTVGWTAVALLLFGAAALLEVLLKLPADWTALQVGSVTERQAANGVALLTVGALLRLRVGRSWQEVIVLQPDEARSAMRRLFLIGGLLIGAVAALTPATLILRELLLMLFGRGSGPPLELYLDLVEPLAFLPIGALLYWGFRGALQREIDAFGESTESVAIARITRYLTAAVGLILSWIGAVEVLQAVVELAGNGSATEIAGRLWIEPLATGLSLLAVGLPVWLRQWQPLQVAARVGSPEGSRERSTGPRRIYLYGFALAGALLVLFSVAQILYRLFLLLLGDPAAGLWSSETAYDLARGVVALGVWLYHIRVIRADGRLTRAHPLADDATDLDETIARLEARIMLLEADLEAARTELAQARSAAVRDPE